MGKCDTTQRSEEAFDHLLLWEEDRSTVAMKLSDDESSSRASVSDESSDDENTPFFPVSEELSDAET